MGKNRSCPTGRRLGPEELEKQQGTVFHVHRDMTMESSKTDTILFLIFLSLQEHLLNTITSFWVNKPWRMKRRFYIHSLR